MNPITLLQPSRVVFGNGCVAQSAEFLVQRGVHRVLLVSSASMLPQLDPVRRALEQAGTSVVSAPPIRSEPTLADFDNVIRVARAERIDAVLGIGGGSALDVAKLVAALARSRESINDVFGINRLRGRELCLVCAPTTSGSGSEVSPNAVLLDETELMKKAVISAHLVPDAAFIDPLLTLSLPPAVTASTGLDALTHCIEAYANRFAHPAADIYALAGIRLISANLVRAVRNGRDVEARANLALASYYGGLCLGPVNTAAVHALAYPLGARFHVAHGVSNAVLLPHVLRFNLPSAPERYAKIAGAFGVQHNGSATGAAEQGIKRIAELSAACAVPQRLSELGIPREAIGQMAKSAMSVTRLLKNNLREVTEEDARRIYEMTY